MQAGFCCLEVGAVRTKNATNIVMKNLLDIVICALVYYLIGYSLGYGNGSCIIGLTYWAGVGLSEASMAHWFFQFIFAATASTILSGAVAERCNFLAYIIYNAAISGFVYPVVSHWVWHEEGWLVQLGYRDFAGSGAVHALAGTCSFVAAALLGPRHGRFQDGKPLEIAGHSTPLVGVGGLLLISGFLAFNGGSLGHATHPGDGEIIARTIVNTIMGGSGAGLILLGISITGLIGEYHWPFALTLNSILTGMVSICGGADEFSSLGALITGALASPIFLGIHYLMLHFQVDDPLDAVAVHFGGGMWGVISMPLLTKKGILYEGSRKAFKQLGYNFIGLLAISAWSASTSLVIFGILKFSKQFRVSEEEEIIGKPANK
ncbi:hypothetical protein AAG570_000387 [Ranatra chinensis]|uniref:Ammonium transporter AmtB-like domain-containing protein n=1 Tax=Ranatra chinensis TaxID=642074 RepID=A0ABD0YX86_9HEMI